MEERVAVLQDYAFYLPRMPEMEFSVPLYTSTTVIEPYSLCEASPMPEASPSWLSLCPRNRGQSSARDWISMLRSETRRPACRRGRPRSAVSARLLHRVCMYVTCTYSIRLPDLGTTPLLGHNVCLIIPGAILQKYTPNLSTTERQAGAQSATSPPLLSDSLQAVGRVVGTTSWPYPQMVSYCSLTCKNIYLCF